MIIKMSTFEIYNKLNKYSFHYKIKFQFQFKKFLNNLHPTPQVIFYGITADFLILSSDCFENKIINIKILNLTKQKIKKITAELN